VPREVSVITSWCAVAVVFVASSILARELARKRGRDEYFYLATGLILGPLAILIILTPLPVGSDRKSELANKPIRFVKGQPCPECRREVGARANSCPYCRASLERAWWENPVSMGNS
jgi:hypothetical protein